MTLARSHALVVAALVLAGAARAQILHVDAALTTGAGDGSSWADAFQGSAGLHQALAAAAPGDEIWVTGGVYLPSLTGDVDESFELATNDVPLRGGFTGVETTRFQRPASGLHPTILSGDLLGNDDGSAASLLDNSKVVLRSTAARALVENLDVVAAQAVVVPNVFDPALGVSGAFDALSIDELTLEHCRFRDSAGGGARIDAQGLGGATRIVDCQFERNGAYGLCVTYQAAGLTSLVIDRCSSTDNDGYGVLMIPDELGTEQFSNSLAARNGANGLRYVLLPEQDTYRTVINCTFADNGLSGVQMLQCQCFGFGVILQQCIVWGNGTPLEPPVFGDGSIVQGLADPVLGADPEFRDAANGDFSLASTSPAIDRGLRQPAAFGFPFLFPAELGPFDLARRHRAVDLPGAANAGPGPDDFVDLGAFEFTGSIGENVGCEAAPNSTGRAGRRHRPPGGPGDAAPAERLRRRPGRPDLALPALAPGRADLERLHRDRLGDRQVDPAPDRDTTPGNADPTVRSTCRDPVRTSGFQWPRDRRGPAPRAIHSKENQMIRMMTLAAALMLMAAPSSLAQRGTAGKEGPPRAQKQRQLPERVKKFDLNGDGRLDEAERKKAAEGRQARRQQRREKAGDGERGPRAKRGGERARNRRGRRGARRGERTGRRGERTGRRVERRGERTGKPGERRRERAGKRGARGGERTGKGSRGQRKGENKGKGNAPR